MLRCNEAKSGEMSQPFHAERQEELCTTHKLVRLDIGSKIPAGRYVRRLPCRFLDIDEDACLRRFSGGKS